MGSDQDGVSSMPFTHKHPTMIYYISLLKSSEYNQVSLYLFNDLWSIRPYKPLLVYRSSISIFVHDDPIVAFLFLFDCLNQRFFFKDEFKFKIHPFFLKGFQSQLYVFTILFEVVVKGMQDGEFFVEAFTKLYSINKSFETDLWTI